MRSKSSALIVTLLAAGAVLVISGLTLALNGAAGGKLTFSHSQARVLGAASAAASKSPGAGSSAAPAASALPNVTPSLSPDNATYPVAGSIVLSPAGTPIAAHAVDVVGSIPAKTFTDAQGHFTLHLPVGHYLLTLNPAVGPGGQSWPFSVARQPLTLNLTANSGR